MESSPVGVTPSERPTRRSLTGRHAIWISALVAALVYVGATRNQWALDDEPVIRDNAAAHSIDAATRAFFSPYWPPFEGVVAGGLYRPVTILSYGIDWSISGGDPAWFHGVNLVLHAVVTALFVSLMLAWLTPAGALVAGLAFAVHPVHVEAVANVVGRAELLVAIGILGAVITARRYRRAGSRSSRAGWLAATLGLMSLALLSKEHGIVGIAVLALDQALEPRPRRFGRSVSLYVGVAALSAAFLFVWMRVAGDYVVDAQAASVVGLSAAERLATMFPAQLDVLRLLTWPMDLAADYNPLMIPRRTEWSAVATLGLVTAGAVVALGFLLARGAPAISFALLAGILAYAPTSNLLFGSGIPLAERNLYFASIGPAAVLGWLVSKMDGKARRILIGAVVGLLGFYTVRTATRIPFWYDTETVIVQSHAEHPENYRNRIRLSNLLQQTGWWGKYQAFAEIMVASTLFPEDPFTAILAVPIALDIGHEEIAVNEAERAERLAPGHPAVALWLVRAYLASGDSAKAVAAASRAIDASPELALSWRSQVEVLDATGAETWRTHLARARLHSALGDDPTASHYLDSASAVFPPVFEPGRDCAEAQEALVLAERLRPVIAEDMRSRARASRGCDRSAAGKTSS